MQGLNLQGFLCSPVRLSRYIAAIYWAFTTMVSCV